MKAAQRSAWVRIAVCLAVGALAAGSVPLRADVDTIRRREQQLKESLDRVSPAVVAITDGLGFGTGVVVSEDGTAPLGILSERDIVREVGRQGSVCLERTVGEIMTRNVSTTSPDEDADSVLRKMTEGRFRHLPVMEEGRMIGLISIGDVVKARIDELAMEKQALEGMIMGH